MQVTLTEIHSKQRMVRGGWAWYWYCRVSGGRKVRSRSLIGLLQIAAALAVRPS